MDTKLSTIIDRYYNSESSGTEQVLHHKFVNALIEIIVKYGKREDTENTTVEQDILKQVMEICKVKEDNKDEVNYILGHINIALEKRLANKEFDGYNILTKNMNPKDLEELLNLLEINIPQQVIDECNIKNTVVSKGNKKGKEKDDENDTPSYEELLSQIYKDNNFVYVRETKQLLYWENGVYTGKDLGEIEIEEIIEDMYPVKYDANDKREIIKHIKNQNGESIKDFIDYTKPSSCNFVNVFYDLKTMEYVEHDQNINNEMELIGKPINDKNIFRRPKHKTLSTIRHPIVFDPHAKCPNFAKWLRTVCNNNAKDMQTLLVLIGNMFYRSYQYPYSLVLVGGANSGKGTFFQLLTNMVGKDNKKSIDLETLMTDKFAKSQLVDMSINIDTELKRNISVKDFANMKRLISNEEKWTQAKFKTGTDSPIWCKCYSSGNDFPVLSINDDEATAKRIVPIGFFTQFWGKDDNKEMLNILTSEMSGIFNAARYAWYYFLYKGNDNLPISLEERKQRMNKLSKQFETFISEKCIFYVRKEEDEDIVELQELRRYFVAKEDLLNAFNQWRIDNNTTSVNTLENKEFFYLIEEEIKKQVEYFERNKWKSDCGRITDRKRFKTENNSRKDVFYGIRLINDPRWEKELKELSPEWLKRLT